MVVQPFRKTFHKLFLILNVFGQKLDRLDGLSELVLKVHLRSINLMLLLREQLIIHLFLNEHLFH